MINQSSINQNRSSFPGVASQQFRRWALKRSHEANPEEHDAAKARVRERRYKREVGCRSENLHYTFTVGDGHSQPSDRDVDGRLTQQLRDRPSLPMDRQEVEAVEGHQH